MSNRCPRPLAAFVAMVCLAVPGRTQSSDASTIRGELRASAPINLHDYFLELSEVGRSNEVHRADVGLDGSFHLRDIRAGVYTLRVTTLQGETVHQEIVTLAAHTGFLTVRLPVLAKTPSAPGTISITQLRHPPGRKALQAAALAQRYSASGNTEKAVEELERAIRISPVYAEAYNNLAVQHMRMRRFDDACNELARAIEIAGPSASTLSNLAYAQLGVNRLPEATASVRAALRLDPSYPQAHLILGTILAQNPRTRAEAIPHLERAAETMPSARDTLEKVRSFR